MSRRLHELAWGGFLLSVLAACLRETLIGSPALSPLLLAAWLALLAGFVWAVHRTGQGELRARQRWGWAYYLVAMNVAFQLLGPTVKALRQWRADDLLQHLDDAVIGENLSLRIEAFTTAAATELFSFAYMFFMVLLFASTLYYLLASKRLPEFYGGLFTVYGIGFAGYVLMPAAGPYVAMADRFHVAIEGGIFSALNALMVSRGSNQVDVFPSLHVAVSLYIWLFLLQDKRRIALALTPLVVALWVSTVYLRYHYFVDLLAGAVLAQVAFLLTRVLPRAPVVKSDSLSSLSERIRP